LRGAQSRSFMRTALLGTLCLSTNSRSGHSEFRHVHTVVPEHPLHAVQVCPASREAFLEIIPIGEIQEFFFDSRDPSRNMDSS
jgi:hypothetical protein